MSQSGLTVPASAGSLARTLGLANQARMRNDSDTVAFLAFRQECIWLQATLNTFSTLFESGTETLELLEAAAPAFFRDLNLILHEHFVLQACRLTDPASQKGRENLTVRNINLMLERRGLLTQAIRDVSDQLHQYRELLTEARNQIISHADKSRILSGSPSPSHERADLDRFISRCKPGPRQQCYCREPGLQHLPPRAA